MAEPRRSAFSPGADVGHDVGGEGPAPLGGAMGDQGPRLLCCRAQSGDGPVDDASTGTTRTQQGTNGAPHTAAAAVRLLSCICGPSPARIRRASLRRSSSRLLMLPGIVGQGWMRSERPIRISVCIGGRVRARISMSLNAFGGCCAGGRPIIGFVPAWRCCGRRSGTTSVISRPCDRRSSR